ncbi:MAG: SDR family oxidoreductase [Hyphomicrobiaceae bacterium]
MTNNHLVCLGLGFSARAIANELAKRGWTITGTARHRQGVDRITAAGYQGFVFDPEQGCEAFKSECDRPPLNTATHLLLSAPPTQNGDPILQLHADALSKAPNLQWIGYLSTIGVYGNQDGRWIDETTPTAPSSARTKRRVQAEQAWSNFANAYGCRFNIFRLAGIYGVGRSAITQLKHGKARRIIKQGQVFNRVHVADIAQAVLRTIDGYGSSTIYNLSDDEPAPPQDVISYGADLLKLALPPAIPFEEAEMSDIARSFYADLKRVRNARLKSDLGINLRYPTYREGLRAIVSQEDEKNS